MACRKSWSSLFLDTWSAAVGGCAWHLIHLSITSFPKFYTWPQQHGNMKAWEGQPLRFPVHNLPSLCRSTLTADTSSCKRRQICMENVSTEDQHRFLIGQSNTNAPYLGHKSLVCTQKLQTFTSSELNLCKPHSLNINRLTLPHCFTVRYLHFMRLSWQVVTSATVIWLLSTVCI